MESVMEGTTTMRLKDGRGSGWVALLILSIALPPALGGCRTAPATPLARAAAAGDSAAMRDLLAAGADSDQPDSGGWTPLQWAARNGRTEAIEILAGAGARVDLPGGRNGWTPLMHAVHKDQTEAVRALLAAGANVNARGCGGVTALILAAGYGQLETVRMLLDGGADPYSTTAGGENALWAAAGGGSIADITDGPPLGSCFPEVIDLLSTRAPDLKLEPGLKTRILGWVARSETCSRLLATLRDR